MTKPLKNVGTSVRVRLLDLAKQRGDDFQLILLRFANERLLYRLATSAYANRFVLKGAALFTVWTGNPHRATRDLDLLGYGDSSETDLRSVFTKIATMTTDDDGVVYDADTIEVGPIREDQEYGGVRVTLRAHVATAKLRLQVDVGFGDAVSPEAVEVAFPALLSFPGPRLRAYPPETVVAEKLEAMVQLGLANSRMKDFYDLRVLSELFAFDGEPLAKAIRATFNRRGTPIPEGVPVALTPQFIRDPGKTRQWSAFASKSGVADPGDLASVMERVTRFVREPLDRARTSARWKAGWPKGGPWST